MDICTKLISMEQEGGIFVAHTDSADLKICFLTDEIVRIRASFDKELAEESYVLMTTAWEDRLDGLFEGERTRVQPVMPKQREDEKKITLSVRGLRLIIEKDPLCIRLLDKDEDELYASVPGCPFVKDSNGDRKSVV